MDDNIIIGSFNSIKKDPEELLLLIDKYVEVKAIKNCSFTGFVHSIDPVSHSIFLLVPKEDSYQIVLIPGVSICEVIELESKSNITIQKKEAAICNPSAIGDRKEKVLQWLKSNLLPARDDGDNIIVGDASLLPPYTLQDICTNNSVVAIQMRKVLDKMPADIISS